MRTDRYCYKHGFEFKSVPVNARGKPKRAFLWRETLQTCRQFLSL